MKYSPRFTYITRFQYNLKLQNKQTTAHTVVVSPKVARDIEHMKDYINYLEKEVKDLKTQAIIFGMGISKS